MTRFDLRLFVEGQDDQQMILHLLGRHGGEKIFKNSSGNQSKTNKEVYPDRIKYQDRTIQVRVMHGVKNLIGKSTVDALMESDNNSPIVGVVIDHDPPTGRNSADSHWDTLAASLRKKGYVIPEGADPKSIFSANDDDMPKLSCWLMPLGRIDCEGCLEDFVRALGFDDDQRWLLAERIVDDVRQLPNLDEKQCFPPHKRVHAVVHSWLAWQADPGRPFGETLGKTTPPRLNHQTQPAENFIIWLRTLLAPA